MKLKLMQSCTACEQAGFRQGSREMAEFLQNDEALNQARSDLLGGDFTLTNGLYKKWG